MYLSVWRMRIAAIAVGFLLFGWMVASGAMPGLFGRGSIQIEYGLYPEIFEGLTVEIDGEDVGTLRRFGQARRTGFEVAAGSHEIRVLHPEMPSQSRTVEVEAGGMPSLLILDLTDCASEVGGVVSCVGFQ